jgi:hypothetical protein
LFLIDVHRRAVDWIGIGSGKDTEHSVITKGRVGLAQRDAVKLGLAVDFPARNAQNFFIDFL